MTAQALVVIDIQNDYFPGGKWTLHEANKAAENAARLIKNARDTGGIVIHVRHEFLSEDAPFFTPNSDGAKIHDSVLPVGGEDVVLKHKVNAFQDTNLKSILDAKGVKDVTFVGSMSHMCIDAATRAASDFGYNVTVVEDACASRDLEFNGKVVPATEVHAAYMSALGFAYANVTTTDDYLSLAKAA
ncbi:MAG: cysteine hydrolase family protein [Pseudomonadota bacterium]